MTTKTISIKDIKWEFYPRSEHSQAQVDLYRSAIESLPPIVVNKNMIGIDGYHRCQAYRQEGKTDIKAEVIPVADKDVLVEAIRRNAAHGLQLTRHDKQTLAGRLHAEQDKEGNWHELMPIADIAILLSVSRDAVENWTKGLREKMESAEDNLIWNLWLACKTEEEIAEAVHLPQRTVHDRISGLAKKRQTANSPEPLKMFNTWYFQECDPRFGIDYPGRIPGQVVEHLLYYYTEPGQIVWDLFGGGGVTIDVCKHMARRYQVFDIEPIRDDIQKHDAANGLPTVRPHMAPSLIFLDPPYGPQKRGAYGKQPTNLVNMTAEKFHQTLASVVKAAMKTVAGPEGDERSGYVALIIGPTQEKWEFQDHAAEMIRLIGVPYHRIQVPYSTEIHGGNYLKMAKENRQWLFLNRDLLIWKKP